MKARQVEFAVLVETVNVSCHGLLPGVRSRSPAAPRRDLLPLEPAGLIVSRLDRRWDLVADLVGLLVDLFDFDGDKKPSRASFFGHWCFPVNEKRKTGAPGD
jgi:hypothetical protein